MKRFLRPAVIAGAVALAHGYSTAQPQTTIPGKVLFDEVVIGQELERRNREAESSAKTARQASDEFRAIGLRTPSADHLSPSRGKIVNGIFTARYPTAGALVKWTKDGKARSWCSGTLIGCGTFLTAQHCVLDPTPGLYSVFLQHAGWRDVAAIVRHPEYVHPNSHADIAAIKLNETAFGQLVSPLRIRPSRINNSTPVPFDTRGTIVGFGRSGGLSYDYGLKREGGIRTASCAPNRSDSDLVCWKFEALTQAPGENSNTCNVDSGGPMFVDGGGGLILLAGVTSGGTRNDCLPSDLSYDANVYTFRDWITAQAGGDLGQATCGPGQQVTEEGTRIQASQGELSSTVQELQVEFPITGPRQLVRLAMNGTDDDVTRFDYFVRLGATATATTFDCHPSTGQYGFCEFSNVSVDQISVLVQRRTGVGNFVIGLTEFD